MIEKLANYFGYQKIRDIPEDELAFMLADKLGVAESIDETYEKKILSDLNGTDGLVAWLREIAAKDKDRYFGAASPMEQNIIRGGFARTMWLRSKIMKADDTA